MIIFDENAKIPSHNPVKTGTLAIIILAAGLVLQAAGQPATTNAPPSATPQLSTRTYKIDAGLLFPRLRTLTGAEDDEPDVVVLDIYFKQKGLDFSPPRVLFYKDRAGTLVVRATEQEQKKVEALLAEIHSKK